jgi:peptidoglycan hydrolase-like protein with peptidoglycan-binding domain
MPLQPAALRVNTRLQGAAQNQPPIRRNDPDKPAVALLQQALNRQKFGTLSVDGLFGTKTAIAVRAIETRFSMDFDDGVGGRQTLGILDILEQNGKLGAELARTDVPLARTKVQAALVALTELQQQRLHGKPPKSLTSQALRVHFRLAAGLSAFGPSRPVTDADLQLIVKTYNNLLALFGAAPARFRSGVPVNGIDIAAEAPLGGPVRFGPAFTDVNSNFGSKIGPNSRAAILIHEGVHVFDGISGRDDIHISEFDPRYDRQSGDLSIHNPSSYAGFAAHIHNGGDPVPRFGLGAAQAS